MSAETITREDVAECVAGVSRMLAHMQAVLAAADRHAVENVQLRARIVELESAPKTKVRAARKPAKPKTSRHVAHLLKQRYPLGVAVDTAAVWTMRQKQAEREKLGEITPALRAQFSYGSRDRTMPDPALLGAIVHGYTLDQGKRAA